MALDSEITKCWASLNTERNNIDTSISKMIESLSNLLSERKEFKRKAKGIDSNITIPNSFDMDAHEYLSGIDPNLSTKEREIVIKQIKLFSSYIKKNYSPSITDWVKQAILDIDEGDYIENINEIELSDSLTKDYQFEVDDIEKLVNLVDDNFSIKMKYRDVVDRDTVQDWITYLEKLHESS